MLSHLRLSTQIMTLAFCANALGCDRGHDEHAAHQTSPREKAPASDTAASAYPPGSPLPPGVNPVQNEMRILNEAARDWVSAIANNELGVIPKTIERIHLARRATETALQSQAYEPPKHTHDIDAFKRQDEAFHESLVALVRAAEQNDVGAATSMFGAVLTGCTGCHLKYRF